MKNITQKQPANTVYMYLRGNKPWNCGTFIPEMTKPLFNFVMREHATESGTNGSVRKAWHGYYREIEPLRHLSREGMANKSILRERSIPLMNCRMIMQL
jgi:hypothetical protein